MSFTGFRRPTTTDTPDEFFDVILPQVTGLAELKVILYVIRHTFGYNKWLDRISLSEFEHGIVTQDKDHRPRRVDGGVGLSRRAIIDGLKGAIGHDYLCKIIICPMCHSEVSPIQVERAYKHRHASGAKTISDAPARCPVCGRPLKGHEHIYYGLHWQDGEAPAPSPRDVEAKYRGLWRDRPSEASSLGGSEESSLPLVKQVHSQQLTPSVLTPAGAGGPAGGPLAPDSPAFLFDTLEAGQARDAHTASPSGNGDLQRDTSVARVSSAAPSRVASMELSQAVATVNEPLPVRRERVLCDLREHAGERRTQIYIVAVNIGQMMGLRWLDGQLRTQPTKEDKAEIGQLCRDYGGVAYVWTVACRMAGHEIAGDPLDYLRGALNAHRENLVKTAPGNPGEVFDQVDYKQFEYDQ